jgi:phosphohistidine phosphatase
VKPQGIETLKTKHNLRLYFLRHGIAQDPAPSLKDEDRALVPEGAVKIRRLARRLESLDIDLSAIYTSPLLRALQTAELVAERLETPLRVDSRLAPGFNATLLQTIIEEHTGGDMLIVGHEPDFSLTLSTVIGGGNITFKKGALARVDLHNIKPPQGSLIFLLTAGLLDD